MYLQQLKINIEICVKYCNMDNYSDKSHKEQIISARCGARQSINEKHVEDLLEGCVENQAWDRQKP